MDDAFSLDASASQSDVWGDTDREEPESDIDSRGDLWSLENLTATPADSFELRSWDVFPNPRTRRSGPGYLTEAGPRGFDAVLVHQATKSGLEDSGRVARSDAFIAALFQLGLGWNSVFFRFNEQSRKFEKHIADARISGISLPALDKLISEFLLCGTWVRKLKRFVAAVPSSESTEALASLARAIFVQLYSIEDQMAERFRHGPSLLETQLLFRRSGCLVRCLIGIVDGIPRCVTDAEVISTVFTKCDHFSHEFVWLADIFHEIMANVADPWLVRVAKWVGIRDASGKDGLNNDEIDGTPYQDHSPSDIAFNARSMPAFIQPELAQAIDESGKGLQLLRSSGHDHPLVEQTKTKTSLSLEWGLGWEDINRIQQKASEYESELRAEILKHSRAGATPQRTRGRKSDGDDGPCPNTTVSAIYQLSDDLDIQVDRSHAVGYQPAISSSKMYDLIARSPCVDLEKNLGAELPFGPPLISALSLSFAPVLSAQTRVINFSCLRLLFKDHKVRHHLQLQWRFQLLGDPSFLERLSVTLFDPHMQSSERKAGVARGGSSTGLRLGNRDTWPPASSELRLVLTGLLSECYVGYNKSPHSSPADNSVEGPIDLPGGLSFSIRELTGEELSKCKNPNSLEALDFLRLQYTSPPVLSEVITPESLHKYDRMFKHLLRLRRMLSVVHDLVRDPSRRSLRERNQPRRTIDQKFRSEALHFVQAVSDYCFEFAVGNTWHNFEATLSRIEKCIDAGDIDGTISHAKSLRRLREYHEDVLDQTLFALLLSKRHVQARQLLDDILRVILAFSFRSKTFKAAQRKGKGGPELDSSYEKSIRELFSMFRKQVCGLVRFLRSLDGTNSRRLKAQHQDLASWGSGKNAEADVNGIFNHLLIRLDMFGFYQ